MKLTIKNGNFYPTPPDGEYLLKEWVDPRNYEQLKKMWVLYTYVENESWNDKEALHDMMKKKFLSKRKLVKLWWKRTYAIHIGSTSKLNKKEMSEFYSNIERFFAELDYVLPPYDSLEYQNLYQSCTF